MYCHNCGEQVIGSFCSNCGTPVAKQKIKDYTSYSSLVADNRCKQIIASEASKAQSSMSGEEFLQLSEQVIPIPMKLIGDFSSKLYANMGLRTGKTRQESLPYTFSYVLLATICSLARQNIKPAAVSEATGICNIEAILPSSMWSWQGQYHIIIESQENKTKISARTEIPGQKFDWGKSKRTLNTLFTEIQELCEEFVGSSL